MYHLNHARGHNSYNDTELGHVFGPSGVDIQIILDRFGKKNNVVSGLLFFLGLVRVIFVHKFMGQVGSICRVTNNS